MLGQKSDNGGDDSFVATFSGFDNNNFDQAEVTEAWYRMQNQGHEWGDDNWGAFTDSGDSKVEKMSDGEDIETR